MNRLTEAFEGGYLVSEGNLALLLAVPLVALDEGGARNKIRFALTVGQLEFGCTAAAGATALNNFAVGLPGISSSSAASADSSMASGSFWSASGEYLKSVCLGLGA